MKSLREQMEWWSEKALYALILCAVAFLSAITTMRIAIQGRQVEVPRVTGMRAGDAQAALAGRGLGISIADRAYSELPVDYVVRQSPAAGAKVKSGQRAHVVLSLGFRKVPIPLFVGRSGRAVRIELLRSGLQVGELSTCHLPDYESDIVVQQSPPPGEAGAGSPRVNLLISLGEREPAFVMPDLEGLPATEALRKISTAGLRLEKATPLKAPGASPGTVVAQQPARGSRIPAGASVQLQIAE